MAAIQVPPPAQLAKDVVYVALGAGVMGIQRIAVARREMQEATSAIVDEAQKATTAALDLTERLLPGPAATQLARSRTQVSSATRRSPGLTKRTNSADSSSSRV